MCLILSKLTLKPISTARTWPLSRWWHKVLPRFNPRRRAARKVRVDRPQKCWTRVLDQKSRTLASKKRWRKVRIQTRSWDYITFATKSHPAIVTNASTAWSRMCPPFKPLTLKTKTHSLRNELLMSTGRSMKAHQRMSIKSLTKSSKRRLTR